ncbi:MAG: hypothetical protein Q9184_006885 [Pyrenodesmia sp. 2 TL-2023]
MKKAVYKVRDMSLEKNVYKKLTQPKVAKGENDLAAAKSAGDCRNTIRFERGEDSKGGDVIYNELNLQCDSGNIPSFWQQKRKEVGGTYADVAVMTVKDGTKDDVDKAWARVFEAMRGDMGTPTEGSAPGDLPVDGPSAGDPPAGGEGTK